MELDNQGTAMAPLPGQVHEATVGGSFPPLPQAPNISFKDMVSHSQPNNPPFDSPFSFCEDDDEVSDDDGASKI